MLGMTGSRLINAPTFLPAYLHLVSGSNAIVGLGLALQQLGGIISPMFAGTKIEHRPKVMPAAVLMGSMGRLAVLGMALSGWLLSGQALVIALLRFIFMFGVFMGAQRVVFSLLMSVVFSLLMSEVIPLSRRGRLQAERNATGGLIAAVLAYVAGKYLIGQNLLGNGYSTTFLCAFILTSAGLWALQLLLREPVTPTLRSQSRFVDRLREFPALVAEDPGFGWFLMVQMLATAARIATPFYILHVGEQMRVDGATLGLLSLAYLGADTISNLLWGYLGDRTGFRLVLLLSIGCWVAATELLMSTGSMALIFIAFFGLGAAQAGYMMGAQTIILEFGDRDDLPMRIAASATAESTTATLGPLLGGWVADWFGYDIVFGASLGFVAASKTQAVGRPEIGPNRVHFA
ncbi:MFS transporter [Sphingomonas sp. 36D10-4-7]|uniref:MFS transporter n=2 Tax=Sphingomonas corticis TaxID=2722791 RepID=A0ABX1CVN0_9SPHN|nr:MFS transporter [Sphingomonas corticis]